MFFENHTVDSFARCREINKYIAIIKVFKLSRTSSTFPEIIQYKMNISPSIIEGTFSGTLMTVQPIGRDHVKVTSVIPLWILAFNTDMTCKQFNVISVLFVKMQTT